VKIAFSYEIEEFPSLRERAEEGENHTPYPHFEKQETRNEE